MITGVDLVQAQLCLAIEGKFELEQEKLRINGHAMQCRINAEDPENDFRPSPGKIQTLHFPGGHGVRLDTHVYSGYIIPPFYDSMIAKLITTAQTRDEFPSRMRNPAVANTIVFADTTTTTPPPITTKTSVFIVTGTTTNSIPSFRENLNVPGGQNGMFQIFIAI